MTTTSASIPVAVVLAAVALVVIQGPAPMLGLFALATLVAGLALLWHEDLSPIFPFIFFYQWAQASTMVLESAFLNIPLHDLPRYDGDLTGATALSLSALLCLAIGMRAGVGFKAATFKVRSLLAIEDASSQFWFGCYLVSFAMSLAITSWSGLPGGLRQPLLALAYVKWVFFWILTQSAIKYRGVVRWQWACAFALEFIIGAAGLFSSFSLVIFFTVFGLISGHARMTQLRWIGTMALGVLALFLGVCWTAIKTEHRQFLTDGERSQSVTVGMQDSIKNIVQLLGDLDGQRLEDGALGMAKRIAYVEFFGVVLDTVPTLVPHQNGAIIADAIARPFMPRLLFPEKPEIDDSERTNEFTGLGVSGRDEGTSISLGYIAESYIDFGVPPMFLPVLLLGYFYGRFYRWITHYKYSRGLIGTGLATVTLFPVAYLETSITKLIGGLVVSMLVAALLARFATPFLKTQIRSPRTMTPRSGA